MVSGALTDDAKIAEVAAMELKRVADLYVTTPDEILFSRERKRADTSPLREFIVRMYLDHLVPIGKICKIVKRDHNSVSHYIGQTGSAYIVQRSTITDRELDLRKVITAKEKQVRELERRVKVLTEKVKSMNN